MSNDVESLLVGCELLMKVSGATKAVIAIKVHKAAVKNAIKAKLAEHPSIKLVEVPDKYPMGWERTLIKQVFKKTYDRLPSELGIVVNNGQTVIELAKVLLTGHPMTDRLVTVSGDAVANPTNVYVKIGTQAKELIEACGGLTTEDAKKFNNDDLNELNERYFRGMKAKNGNNTISFNEFKYFTGITLLPDNFFAESDLSVITLPNTIERIGTKNGYNDDTVDKGEGMFSGCTKLTNITFPKISVRGAHLYRKLIYLKT